MAISGPNFKMQKQNKIFLSHIRDVHLRGQIKKALISAQIAEQAPVRRQKSDKNEA